MTHTVHVLHHGDEIVSIHPLHHEAIIDLHEHDDAMHKDMHIKPYHMTPVA
jgi:hypothetical protein